MANAAAFQACFTDWRLVKGRKVIQVVLEIPLEGADLAYQALGGMPDPSKSVWVAVARLQNESSNDQTTNQIKDVTAGKDRRPFTDLPLAQQAAMLCNDRVFQAYLNENYKTCRTADQAKALLCEICVVKSRSELLPETPAGESFKRVRERYFIWKTAPP